ncbi:MAG TPA: hypothetical protein VF604_20090 [Pyrinomonadaceae bacterium]|jgi:hypothetical protein
MKSYKIRIFSLLLLFLCVQLLEVHSQKSRTDTPDFRVMLQKKLDDYQKVVTKNGQQVKTKGVELAEVCSVDTDLVSRRVFADYGAIFIAENVEFPRKCIFQNEQEVSTYQNSASAKTETLDGTTITLQEEAMEDLLKARREAAKRNLKITPRGGSIAARRSYTDTQRLWDSRFSPGLKYWVAKRKISRQEAEQVKNLPTRQQVSKVLEWESKGWFFSTDFSKSILYSVAAPGASQHLFMLALDVEQFANPAVREILARHGWFQTVQSDLPHFTYLGLKETELPEKGLKAVFFGGQKFWIPNLKANLDNKS